MSDVCCGQTPQLISPEAAFLVMCDPSVKEL